MLRYEIHFSGKDHVEWHNLTRIIDEVEQSPAGRWRPSVVRFGRIKKHGDELSNEPVPFDPERRQTATEMGPVSTMMFRYNVTFTEE